MAEAMYVGQTACGACMLLYVDNSTGCVNHNAAAV